VLALNKPISDFLNKVCEEIKYKNIHEAISEELKGHIYELIEGYIEDGMDENSAVEKAIEQMGNPVYIGNKLNKTHKPKTEWSIMVLVSMMILIGGITLFSIANNTPDHEISLITFNVFLKNYLVYVIIGIAVGTTLYFSDYTKLEKYALHMFIATILFSIFIITLFYKINGTLYIQLGRFSLLSESIVLPFFLISFSGLANKLGSGNSKDMFKLLGLGSIALFISMAQLPFRTALLLGFGFLIIIIMAIMSKEFKGNKKKFLFSIYGSAAFGSFSLLLSIILNKYKLRRLLIFLNPHSDPEGAGYINLLLEQMLSNAKLFGESDNLYFTHSQLGYTRIIIPEAHTDFVFTYIVSAFGWVLGILTIMVITLVIARMFLATRKINHQYGRFLASSITLILGLQALGNILMNFGMFPITGLSLPFISYGGTNFVINMALIGLLLSIYRKKDIVMIKIGYSQKIND